MTTITVAIYTDGTLQEQLSDATTPAQHIYYDTDGTTVLSTVDATPAELDMLRLAAAPVVASTGILSGSGPPGAGVGVDGDVYVDVDTNLTYGPKASGAWPSGATVELARA